jgi:hypothetical protein
MQSDYFQTTFPPKRDAADRFKAGLRPPFFWRLIVRRLDIPLAEEFSVSCQHCYDPGSVRRTRWMREVNYD